MASMTSTSVVLVETAVTVAGIYAVGWWVLRRHDATRRATRESPARDGEPPLCSFCGKSQDEVRNLIAGPKVYICDECIDLCNDIIAEGCEQERRLANPRPSPRPHPGWETGAMVLVVVVALLLLAVYFAQP
jgi:hypothetical protein